MRYKQSDPFYHSAAWKKVRAAALARDQGMCRDCMALFDAGMTLRPHRATMVHHIEPLEQRPDLALRLDNLISLCDECHNRRHPEKGGSGEKPTAPPGMRVIKI